MRRTVFRILRMDCAAEESIVRMSLQGISSIAKLKFDLANRTLTVFHSDNLNEIHSSIDTLNFDSVLISTEEITEGPIMEVSDDRQASLLWKVLVINGAFFIIEMVTGVISHSMGLVADSLDMLADALVYGLSLLAVGTAVKRKKSIAAVSGYLQICLALIGLIEVIRRFIGIDEAPEFHTMIIVSILALMANSICLHLLHRSKSEDAHMKASMIFTSNDVIVNVGVITAGVLVYVTESKYPDLIVGGIVFVLVLRGALSILKLAR